jgi:hypothetical protein
MRTSTRTGTGSDTGTGTQACMGDGPAWGRLIAEPLTWWRLSGGGDDGVGGDVELASVWLSTILCARNMLRSLGKYRIHRLSVHHVHKSLCFACLFLELRKARIGKIPLSTTDQPIPYWAYGQSLRPTRVTTTLTSTSNQTSPECKHPGTCPFS